MGLYGTLSLQITNDASEAMLPADEVLLSAYEDYLEEFPSDQTFILVLSNLACSTEGWALMESLGNELDSKPFVEKHYSLVADSAKFVQASSSDIDIRSFREVAFSSPQERCEVASTYSPFSDVLTTEAGQYTAMYVSTDEALDAVSASSEIRQLLKPFQERAEEQGGSIIVSGEAILSAELSEAVARDSLLIGLSITLMTALVFALTRSFRTSILVIGLIAFVIGIVFGFMGYLDIAYTPSTSLVVFLLVPLSAAFAIHAYGYVVRHAQGENTSSSSRAFAYAGLTTAIGFACTGLTPASDIKNLAIVGVLGVATILVGLNLFVVPHLAGKTPSKFLLGNVVPRYFFTQPLIAWCALVLLIVITVLGLSRITISYGPSDFLPDSNPIKSDYLEVGDLFGRMNVPLIVSVDDLRDPETWLKLRQIIEYAETNVAGTLTTIWFYDHMSELATAFYEGAHDFPQNGIAFEQLELFFERSDTELFWNDQEDNIAIHFQIPFSGSDDYMTFRDLVMSKADDLDLKVGFVGRVSSFFETGHRVGRDTLVGLCIASILIFFVLVWMFRDFRLALIGVSVNVIPVLFGLGVLGIIGTPIDMGSAIVAAIAFGIVLDDSTHLLVHIDQLIKSGYDPNTATNKAIRDLVAPIVSTTIAISLGFLVLFLAEVALFSDFALLISTTLACALIVDVWILPLLVKTGLRDRAVAEY